MREILKGYIVPDYIVRRVEIPSMGRKAEHRLLFVKSWDYNNREFLKHCMNERDLGGDKGYLPDGSKTALRRFFESTTFVMNVWEDPHGRPRWKGDSFTSDQYMDLVNRCQDLAYREQFYRSIGMKPPTGGKLYVPQYGKAKWPTGGGMNASAAGKFFYSDRDVTGELFKDFLHVDPEELDPRERVSRTSILFGNSRRFSVPPRIVFADYETGGTCIIDSEYAAREGIHHGDKLWPAKASAVVSKLHIEGADMVIPKDAIKFEAHRDVEVLAPLMGSIPELSAEARSSEAKGRLPKMAFDTMQWLFPELEKILGNDPRLLDQLALVRRVVEGTATLEEMASLGEYTDAEGKPAYPREFHYLLNGHPKEEGFIRDAVFKAAGTAALRALCFKVRGKYGVAMPLTTDASELTLLLPPWMLPFKVKGSNSLPHVVCAESDFVLGCLGKDFDGDLGMSLEVDGLQRRLGLPKDTFPNWNDPADKRWAKAFLSLPDKLKEATGRSTHQVMADGLKSYRLIGIATNIAAVVVDALRSTGRYSRRQLQGIYLRMYSVEVQPFVDALKYDPKDLVAPSLVTRYDRNGKVKQLGLAEKYGIDPDPASPDWGKPLPGIESRAKRIKAYFGAVRNMWFEELSGLPEDQELSGSFYYRLSRLFVGWKPYPEVDVASLARELAVKYPITDRLEAKRSQSFPLFKGLKGPDGKHLTPELLARKRWEYLEDDVVSAEIAIGLVARCFIPNKRGTRDTFFGLYISRRTGVSLVEGIAAKEELVNC